MPKLAPYILIAASLTASGTVQSQSSHEYQLSRYEWPVRESADAMLGIPQLRQAILQLLAASDRILMIHYSGGVAGNEWALTLKNHLVALGIEGQRIRLRSPSGDEEILLLEIVSRETAQ